MFMKIYAAITKFQVHLVAHVGRPIGLETISAFNKMINEIIGVTDTEQG